jgi:threonine synthase
VAVATAHAAKFDAIVEPLLGTTLEPPAELAELLKWPAKFDTIDVDLGAVAQHL